MARTRKPKPTAAPFVERPPRVVQPLPEWFAPPVRSGGLDHPTPPTSYNTSAYEVAGNIADGFFALPPWQRDDVWTTEQRHRMIDSMTRGLPVGPIIVWRPTFDRLDLAGARPLHGHPINPRAGLVIDGRQRLTTLAMAAAGELPIRWTGERWHEGNGVIELAACMRCMTDSLDVAWSIDEFSKDALREYLRVYELIHFYQFTFLELRTTSLAEVVETYRRLATCGTQHSLADLEVMERWLARECANADQVA